MKNVFIINAHEPWPFSEGMLNRSMVKRATANLKNKGYDTQMTSMQDNYNVDEEMGYRVLEINDFSIKGII